LLDWVESILYKGGEAVIVPSQQMPVETIAVAMYQY
jgi:hypothetical protein